MKLYFYKYFSISYKLIYFQIIFDGMEEIT